jgi:hypothetical protein
MFYYLYAKVARVSLPSEDDYSLIKGLECWCNKTPYELYKMICLKFPEHLSDSSFADELY